LQQKESASKRELKAGHQTNGHNQLPASDSTTLSFISVTQAKKNPYKYFGQVCAWDLLASATPEPVRLFQMRMEAWCCRRRDLDLVQISGVAAATI
jgi:hypothetical protein